MKNFPNACFPPETLGIMKDAMEAAVAELPDPVSSAQIQSIAETILRTANDGETDPAILQRMALLELQITRETSTTLADLPTPLFFTASSSAVWALLR
jgi:hypothetical protein